MKKVIAATALALGLTGCASSTLVKMDCKLWDAVPATEQRKFVYQGRFTDSLAEVAGIAGMDRLSVDAGCKAVSDPEFLLGVYQP